MPTTRHTLVNSSRRLLKCIGVQVIYNFLQKYLIPPMRHYLICHLQIFLRIFKFVYPALNIAINSSTSSHALKPCKTPFSTKFFTIYGLPITILEHSVGTIQNITIGYIDTFWLSTMVLGHATNIM